MIHQTLLFLFQRRGDDGDDDDDVVNDEDVKKDDLDDKVNRLIDHSSYLKMLEHLKCKHQALNDDETLFHFGVIIMLDLDKYTDQILVVLKRFSLPHNRLMLTPCQGVQKALLHSLL